MLLIEVIKAEESGYTMILNEYYVGRYPPLDKLTTIGYIPIASVVKSDVFDIELPFKVTNEGKVVIPFYTAVMVRTRLYGSVTLGKV